MDPVGWIVAIVGISLFVISLAAYLLVRHYVDPRDNSKLTTFVSTCAIVTTLFCVFIIPVDIFTVSSSLNPDGSQTDPNLVFARGDGVKYLYYSFYILLLFFAFFALPFAYFFFEEDGEDKTDGQRACGAMKYTIAFVAVFIILLVLGLVLKTEKGAGTNSWIQKLSDAYSMGDAIIGFAISSLAVLGLAGWITYTAYGLAYLPLSLMTNKSTGAEAMRNKATGGSRSSRSIVGRGSASGATQATDDDLESDMKKNKNRIDYIESKYKLSGREWTPDDKTEVAKLRAEERRLKREKESRVRAVATSGRGAADGGNALSRGANAVGDKCASCWNCLAPFRIVIAIPLFMLSLLIVISMSLSVVDKFMHSECKTSCGYAISKPQIINPLDVVLKFTSRAFPFDFLIFGGLVTYIFICAISGLVSLGVRFMCFKFYSVRAKKTAPHALLLGAWFLTFTVLVLNMQMLVLSPQYATFGTQFYYHTNNSTGVPVEEKLDCIVENISDNRTDSCVMTQVATFINQNSVQLPFFGVMLFYANLGFLAMYVVFQIAAVCQAASGKESYHELEEDGDHV